MYTADSRIWPNIRQVTLRFCDRKVDISQEDLYYYFLIFVSLLFSRMIYYSFLFYGYFLFTFHWSHLNLRDQQVMTFFIVEC